MIYCPRHYHLPYLSSRRLLVLPNQIAKLAFDALCSSWGVLST